MLLVFLFLCLGMQLVRAGIESFSGNLAFVPQKEALSWWSPVLWLPLATFVFLMFPLGWAYWLVERVHSGSAQADRAQELSAISPIAGVWMVLAIGSAVAVTDFEPTIRLLANVAALVAALTWGCWRLNELWGRKKEYTESEAIGRTLELRNRLGRWLTYSVVATVLMLVVALVDSLGQTAYLVLRGSEFRSAPGSPAFSARSVSPAWAAGWRCFSRKERATGRPRIPLKILATLVAIVPAAAILIALNCASHAVAWGGELPAEAPSIVAPTGAAVTKPGAPALRSAAASAKYAKKVPQVLVDPPQGPVDLELAPAGRDRIAPAGRFRGIPVAVHPLQPDLALRQSFVALADLRCAADPGLPRRLQQKSHRHPEGVGFDPGRRRRHRPGGLLAMRAGPGRDHQSDADPPDQRHHQRDDRRRVADRAAGSQGHRPALGPCGWSAGIRHHPLIHDWDKKTIEGIYPEGPREYRIFRYRDVAAPERNPTFPGEALTLGRWLAISGAAFSTGTGMRTSLGMSFLAGFANVRLGHRWDSGLEQSKVVLPAGVVPKRKLSSWMEDQMARSMPVQTHLLDEFLARFGRRPRALVPNRWRPFRKHGRLRADPPAAALHAGDRRGNGWLLHLRRAGPTWCARHASTRRGDPLPGRIRARRGGERGSPALRRHPPAAAPRRVAGHHGEAQRSAFRDLEKEDLAGHSLVYAARAR